MTLVNISLCLPAPDIVALQTGHSIVAITKRFIVPSKSFALLSCNDFLGAEQLESVYQTHFLEKESAPNEKITSVTHWASCVLCQPIEESRAISTIANRTIWTEAALRQHNGSRLFLSFLRIYKLPKAVSLETVPACDQLYKFMPLPIAVKGDRQAPVLSTEDFTTAQEAFLNPEPLSSDSEGEKDEPRPPTAEEILNSPDWVSKITEYGNSSDGHTFEKLVRKALIELGFSNSQNHSAMSLDPTATGGAGGLDFYADQPYPIVGECKATSTDKVNSNAAAQLIVLGMKHLLDDYKHCIKLVVAAGQITNDADQIARAHHINVIRPETLQSLVQLRQKYSTLADPDDLKSYLASPPFSTAVDPRIKEFVQEREAEFKNSWQLHQQGMQIVQTVKELSEQTIHNGRKSFSGLEIRAHYNAKYHPHMTDETIQESLKTFCAPWTGFLALKTLPDGQNQFSFVKNMPAL